MFAKFLHWFKLWLLTDPISDPDLGRQYYSITYITLSGMPFSFILYPGSHAVPERKNLTMKTPFAFPVKDEEFRTSSWTGGIIARCVMVARTPEGVAVRDTKDESKTTLFFKNDEWDAFLKGAKAGEFDLAQ